MTWRWNRPTPDRVQRLGSGAAAEPAPAKAAPRHVCTTCGQAPSSILNRCGHLVCSGCWLAELKQQPKPKAPK